MAEKRMVAFYFYFMSISLSRCVFYVYMHTKHIGGTRERVKTSREHKKIKLNGTKIFSLFRQVESSLKRPHHRKSSFLHTSAHSHAHYMCQWFLFIRLVFFFTAIYRSISRCVAYYIHYIHEREYSFNLFDLVDKSIGA